MSTEDEAMQAFADYFFEHSHEILSDQGLCIRLTKDGNVWDYSTHAKDIERWSLKILAEEPDAKLEYEVTSVAEWIGWRIGF